MNIYFSCSLTGGRDDETIYGIIVRHLLKAGHEVPTAHLANPEVMQLEQIVDPFEVYQRDIGWLQACDCLIAEVSTPSHGVGYEIARVLQLKKPALCCYRKGKKVSKMILGNDSPGLMVQAYQNEEQVIELVDDFLGTIAEDASRGTQME
jgi:hypothetical protein